MSERPEVVCLCGSLRFPDALLTATRSLTLAGAIVLGPVDLGPASGQGDGHGPTAEEVRRLGELHLRRIDLADRVLVVDPGGYVGESVRREIAYARARGKPVAFTEPRPPE